MTISHEVNIGNPLLVATQLLNDLNGQHLREAHSYADGYRDGYRAGVDVGDGAAEHRMAQDWHRAYAVVRSAGGASTTTERAAMDASAAAGVPCPATCGRCSRCIRADAVARRGDYTGGPIPWESHPIRRTA